MNDVTSMEQGASAKGGAMARKIRRDYAPVILATILTIGYFCVLTYVLTQPIPKDSERIVDMMIGSLLTQWIVAMGYFFNTTAGSAKKTELLAKSGPVDPHS